MYNTAIQDEAFSRRLVLPVSCTRLGHPPSPEFCASAERANAGVFGFLLQGVDLEAMPRPADERLAEALAPLRIKLDMIIDLLAGLSYRDVELPPPCAVELEAGRIAWHSAQPLQFEDWQRIELYFHPSFRAPIVVFGLVRRCAEQGGEGGWRVEADLAEVSDGAADNLARLSFVTQRHQRGQPSNRAARREP